MYPYLSTLIFDTKTTKSNFGICKCFLFPKSPNSYDSKSWLFSNPGNHIKLI